MILKDKALLTKEDFAERTDLPDWLLKEYRTFHETVTDKTFPCYFGMGGELKGELRYGYITQNDWSNLPETVSRGRWSLNNEYSGSGREAGCFEKLWKKTGR